MLQGTDVHGDKGSVDWNKVRVSGVDFCMIKATEGATYTDRLMIPARLEAIEKSGLIFVGPYHFAYPENGSDWKAEAMHYLKVCKAAGVDWSKCVPILDIERNGPIPEGPWCQKWCDFIENAIGRRGLIYAGYYFWRDNAKYGRIRGWKRWTPWYDRSTFPPGDPWPETFIWQNSERGRISGISGLADTNVFKGTAAELKSYVKENV